jgi:NADH:ubiquinone oxidoreductase subunit D
MKLEFDIVTEKISLNETVNKLKKTNGVIQVQVISQNNNWPTLGVIAQPTIEFIKIMDEMFDGEWEDYVL